MVTQSGHLQLVQRAMAALQRGSRDEAAALAQQVLAQFGADANALMILGLARLQIGNAAEAVRFLERAREAMPTHIHVLVNLGSAYRALGRLHDARLALEEALGIDRRFAIAHNGLGNVLLDSGDRAAAKKAYERALVAQASYPDPIAGLARIAEEEHRLDDARRLAERALALAPQNVSAKLTRARVAIRQDEPAAAVGILEALLAGGEVTHTNRVVAEGYLGEALEKLKRFDDAFAAFTRANGLQHAQHAAQFADDRGPLSPKSIAGLTAYVSSLDVSTWQPAPPAQRVPVFLVGFPRSGTTLLDQILASHPQVTTLEERDTLLDAVKALFRPEHGFEDWARLSPAAIEKLREAYWRQVDFGLSGQAVKGVFVDKLPLNAAFLPVIHRLWPNARIILALRDPRDVVLSCYQQRFGMSTAMFQLLKLDTAAAYYDKVMALVRASRGTLPLNIHEVKYESVIADFETTTRGLLSFLGLEWSEAVRNYAEIAKTRAIGTPSAAQVVRPLYRTAQGKWRNYRRFLEPQLPELEPWVEALGYEPS